jgi:DNA polymerase-1
LVYRAFFALLSRPLTTAHGENTSAAWGIANFLFRLRKSYAPDYVAWIHDSGLSFRHQVYPAYKATREKLTEELQADFDRGVARIEQLLAAFRVPLVTVAGYEADDVIGSMTTQALNRDMRVVIVSGDKDFQQLVRPGVWLLNPGRGGPAGVEEHWVSVRNAEERLGVPPERVTDYLALVGDSSDNVPGVPGIGDKTARELVRTHGDLEAILAAAPTISGKRPREALLAHAEQARLSKKLVTIHGDVPIELDLDALQAMPPDTVRLRQLFLELEFATLLKELEPEAERTTRTAVRSYRVVGDDADLRHVIGRAREVRRLAISVETVPERGAATASDPLRSRVVGLAIAVAEGEAWYLPIAHREHLPEQTDLLPDQPVGAQSETESAAPSTRGRRKLSSDGESLAARALATGRQAPRNLPGLDSPGMSELVALLTDAGVAKIAHNAKFVVLVLRRARVPLRGLEFDTMVASYVLDPGRRSHGLDLLALEFLDHTTTTREQVTGRGRTEIPFDEVPTEAARDYACEGADLPLRLRESFLPQLASLGLDQLFHEVEMPLVEVLADMEEAGVCIDLGWFRSLKERFQREREQAEAAIHSAAGEPFNVNSNQQLRTILFDKLGLPVRKRTTTGPSTDASVLQELADEGHLLPSLLMEYRELAKLESTYLDTLPALVHPDDGRLHTSFNQTVAATGRLSSSDPNLQNIPIRRELGRAIRRGFVAQPGSLLLVADYSQIELRLLAHLSRDPAFVDAFTAGGDIHRQSAAVIFGVPLDAVTAEMRARAKTINFATIYGQGANALARQLRIPVGEAKAFITTYFERFGGIRSYLDSQVAVAKERGYVETIFRRRRYVPELRDRNFSIRAFGERVATNAPIQGSAADLIKVAMIRIHRRLHERALRGRMILQVHDELVFEVPESEVDTVRPLVKHEMEHAAELSVPLVVDIGEGPNWLDAKA